MNKNASSEPNHSAQSDDKVARTKVAKESHTDFDSQSFLTNCSHRPGVYQMYDGQQQHLYIGKAKNLKKRLASYFRHQPSGSKTEALVKKIAHIDVTVTGSETEALILEHNLIKTEKPPYNILLRDDKSYPYIYISSQHDFPRLAFHRGQQREKGRYFGPFPNRYAVRESLKLLQKMFKVRQCEDSFFNNRTRPCLQHQIGRCSAPCVDNIQSEEYADSVRKSMLFLEGDNDDLTKQLSQEMDSAAEQLDFEQAAEKRDQLAHLRRIQEKQFIDSGRGDIDIVAGSLVAQGQVVFDTVGALQAGFFERVAWPGNDIRDLIIESNQDKSWQVGANAKIVDLVPVRRNKGLSGGETVNFDFTADQIVVDNQISLSGQLIGHRSADGIGSADFSGSLLVQGEPLISEAQFSIVF